MEARRIAKLPLPERKQAILALLTQQSQDRAERREDAEFIARLQADRITLAATAQDVKAELDRAVERESALEDQVMSLRDQREQSREREKALREALARIAAYWKPHSGINDVLDSIAEIAQDALAASPGKGAEGEAGNG